MRWMIEANTTIELTSKVAFVLGQDSLFPFHDIIEIGLWLVNQ